MDIHSLKTKASDALRGLREPWASSLATEGNGHSDIFHSARLKLTAFYFAILVVFCLLLTFGVQAFTQHELNRGDNARSGAVQQWLQQWDDQNSMPDNFAPPNGRFFDRTQAQQSDRTRQNLTRDYIILDIMLLAGGAVLSYWYAGRTLRPIQEMHEQQKRFTSDASHELRTPLASMKLENEVFLRQKEFTQDDARDLITSNLEEVDRLEKLATSLLSLNHYEHGDMSHAPVIVDELVQTAVNQVKRSKHARKITFTQDIVGAKVDVNRDSMVELFTILLDNAAKYGPKDGTVEVTGRMDGESYVITVRDHGPGIGEEDLPHIFERMYRGDKARSSKISGHGIGLSLAQQIAAANEVTLEAGNAEGGGAVFTLTLQ